MDKLLELEDIALYPAELNNGYQLGKYNYGVLDDLDKFQVFQYLLVQMMQ